MKWRVFAPLLTQVGRCASSRGGTHEQGTECSNAQILTLPGVSLNQSAHIIAQPYFYTVLQSAGWVSTRT